MYKKLIDDFIVNIVPTMKNSFSDKINQMSLDVLNFIHITITCTNLAPLRIVYFFLQKSKYLLYLSKSA